MSKEEKKLTAKEEAFCYNYVMDAESRWNATKSAIKAGYSKKTANAIACENLTKPNIKKRISELCKDIRTINEELINRVIE